MQRLQAKLENLSHRSEQGVHGILRNQQARHSQLVRMLHGLSPLPTLARGYAVLRNDSGDVVSSIGQVAEGQTIRATLEDGTINAKVSLTTEQKLEDAE